MWSRDGLELHQFLVSVSSRQKITMSWSRLFASRGQDFVLPKLVWIKGIEYCTNFLSLSEQGVYAWSRLHVTAPYKLILCVIIIIINRRENKVTTAVIITCRPRPIFTSQWHLVTYKRLVSGFNVSCPSLCWSTVPFWVLFVHLFQKRTSWGLIVQSLCRPDVLDTTQPLVVGWYQSATQCHSYFFSSSHF